MNNLEGIPAGLGIGLLLLALNVPAYGQILPNMFTEAEKKLHLEKVEELSFRAGQCLNEALAIQREFFDKYGVSKFYGDQNPEYTTLEKRREALERLGKPPELAELQEPISCIGLARRCLSEGFRSVGQDSTWAKIDRELARNRKYDGTDLQKMLGFLGWKILYWNPDPSQNEVWDFEDRMLNPRPPGKSWHPAWGGHVYNYNMVMKKGIYYGVTVIDPISLVGFKEMPPRGFRNVKFFVGSAHSGYHVFPGTGGYVVEGHSSRKIDSIDNIEFSEFNPLANEGGPRWSQFERYRSGIIAIPPRSSFY